MFFFYGIFICIKVFDVIGSKWGEQCDLFDDFSLSPILFEKSLEYTKQDDTLC